MRLSIGPFAVLFATGVSSSTSTPLKAQLPSRVFQSQVVTKIGSEAADVIISSLGDAGFQKSNRLLLLDWKEGVAISVDVAGKGPARTIGKAGAGPGEFRTLDRFGWKGDTAWMFDSQLRRISFFQNEKFVRSTSFQPNLPSGITVADPLSIGTSGITLALGMFQLGTLDNRVEQGYALFSLSHPAAPANIVRRISRRNSELQVPVNFRGASSVMRGQQPLSDDPVWAHRKNGGVVVVERKSSAKTSHVDVRVQVYTETGALSSEKVLQIPARPVDRNVRNEVMSLFCGRKAPSTEELRCDDAAMAKALFMPPTIPAVSRVTSCSDGAVWLRLADWPRNRPQEFLILTRDLQPMGTTVLPATSVVLDCYGDLFATAPSLGWQIEPEVTVRRLVGSKR